MFVKGGLTFKFDKNSTIFSVSYFNMEGFGAAFGGAKPTKIPRCDGTVAVI